MPGRDPAELAKIATALEYRSEWKAYNEKTRAMSPRSYSYSFETREFYFDEDPEHRKRLMGLYGDGRSPMYIIAIKGVYNVPLKYSDIGAEIRQIVGTGRLPFIGCWHTSGNVYTGVSILVDHGILDSEVLALLVDYGQRYAARLTPGGMTYFPPNLRRGA